MKKIVLALFLSVFVVVSTGIFYQSKGKNFHVSQKESRIERIASIDDPGELFTIAHDYFEGEHYDLPIARKALSRQILLNSTFSKYSWYQLGRIDFLEGKFYSAIYKFDKQIELFGDEVPNVYYMIGLTYGYLARQTGDENHWQKAEEGFQKAVAYFPDEPWPMVDLAWIYFSEGKYTEMRQFLQGSVFEYADNPWYLNMFALSLLHTGEQETAHEYFKLAEKEAAELTTAEWGRSYPGNDPDSWAKGLEEMQNAIAHNVEISRAP